LGTASYANGKETPYETRKREKTEKREAKGREE